MTSIELDRSDATELAELLTLLSDGLSGPDREVISQSLRRFIGLHSYDLPDLHADLARFTFPLRASPATAAAPWWGPTVLASRSDCCARRDARVSC